MKTALTIAGSDSSGGAGIQADIKTMTVNGVFAMSAITALTAQNTVGVQGIFEVTPEFLGMQIDSVFTDIRPDAVKIGMVSSSKLISMIAGKLKEYQAENIVVDPVMVATSGSKLICSSIKGNYDGFMENGLIIQIRMVLGVPFQRNCIKSGKGGRLISCSETCKRIYFRCFDRYA